MANAAYDGNAPGWVRWIALFATALAALALSAPAANAQLGQPRSSASKPVEFSAALSRPSARAGEAVDVTVTAKINAPYHIYSVTPVPPPGPQETKVTVEGAGVVAVGANRETSAKFVDDPNFGKKIGMHEGSPVFTQTVTIAPSAKPGPLPLSVSVRYMACTESACLPPKTVTIEVPALTVEAGEARPDFLPRATPADASAAGPVGADPTPPAAVPVKSGPTRWTAAPANLAEVRPGEAVAIRIKAEIEAPYHIYSVVPVPAPGPQETKITVEGAGVEAVGGNREPEPKVVNDPNFGKEIGMHEGSPVFTQVVTVGKDAAPGPLSLTVKARYMACTESACLPPKTVELPVTLTVEAGAPRPEMSAAAVGSTAGGGGDATAPTTGSGAGGQASGGSGGGLGAFLLAAFGAGLLALVTPCVFPMIPVTLAFFTKQAAKDEKGEAARGAIVKLAAVYSLGIIVAFTGIGAIMAATVGAAGANRLAANPWVNLVFAVLFVVFALALLEVLDLQPPMALQKVMNRGRSVGGTLGVLGMGLTFVIAAFTCTAPFIGTVLVAAASANTGGEWIRPILGMAVFATALALPFFLLALFPSLLAKMPRSGAWLSTVKGAMGFLELAAALKFLSNADLVWQWKLLTLPVVLAVWSVIAFAGAFWLLGLLKIGFGAPEGKVSIPRGAWAALFAAAGVYCLYGLTGRPVNPLVASLLPPPEYGYAAKAEELDWVPTIEEGIAKAKAEGKPIFVDFTGYTCTNCRWVEQNVFTQPGVRDLLKQKYVLVRLYTDDQSAVPEGKGTLGDLRQAYQEKTFGTIALPLYAVLDADGNPVRQGDVDFFGGTRSPAKFGENFAAFLAKDAPADSANVARN